MHSFPVASVATAAARTATRRSAAAVGGAGRRRRRAEPVDAGRAFPPFARSLARSPARAFLARPRSSSSAAAAGGGDVPALTGGRTRAPGRARCPRRRL